MLAIKQKTTKGSGGAARTRSRTRIEDATTLFQYSLSPLPPENPRHCYRFLLRHDATSNRRYQVCGSKKNDARGSLIIKQEQQKLVEFEGNDQFWQTMVRKQNILQSTAIASSTLFGLVSSFERSESSNMTASETKIRDVFHSNRPANESFSAASSTEYQPSAKENRRIERLLVQSCKSCHVGLPAGPPFWRQRMCIFDEPSGIYRDQYPYSQALLASGVIWDEKTLDKWLEDPQQVIPGSSMNGIGTTISDPVDRKAIIMLLKAFCIEEDSDGLDSENLPPRPGLGGPTLAPNNPPGDHNKSAANIVAISSFLWMGSAVVFALLSRTA